MIKTLIKWGLRNFTQEGVNCAFLYGVSGGESVTTSVLVRVEGNVCTTFSGSQYQLSGPPERSFGHHFLTKDIDPRDPLANLHDFEFQFSPPRREVHEDEKLARFVFGDGCYNAASVEIQGQFRVVVIAARDASLLWQRLPPLATRDVFVRAALSKLPGSGDLTLREVRDLLERLP